MTTIPMRGPDCACCEKQPQKKCHVPGCTMQNAPWALPPAQPEPAPTREETDEAFVERLEKVRPTYVSSRARLVAIEALHEVGDAHPEHATYELARYFDAILALRQEPATVRETCTDCGKRDPCDDDCPNFVEPDANWQAQTGLPMEPGK